MELGHAGDYWKGRMAVDRSGFLLTSYFVRDIGEDHRRNAETRTCRSYQMLLLIMLLMQ